MKTLAGTIGFMMLFAIPMEATWKALGFYLVWLAVAISLLAYGGAFKKKSSTNKTI